MPDSFWDAHHQLQLCVTCVERNVVLSRVGRAQCKECKAAQKVPEPVRSPRSAKTGLPMVPLAKSLPVVQVTENISEQVPFGLGDSECEWMDDPIYVGNSNLPNQAVSSAYSLLSPPSSET